MITHSFRVGVTVLLYGLCFDIVICVSAECCTYFGNDSVGHDGVQQGAVGDNKLVLFGTMESSIVDMAYLGLCYVG